MSPEQSLDPPVAAVQVFLDSPAAAAGVARTFWSRVTGWPPAWPWAEHPELSTLTPPAGAPGLSVQEADVDARVHLDLYPSGRPADLVERLEALGAGVVQRHDWWTVLESPGGLVFCVIDEPSGEPPPATTWPDGHRSRLVQACVDIPDAHWQRESKFWRACLGWPPATHDRPEYAGFEAPPRSPLRMLLQRLSPADTSSTARVHLDLGTDDLQAEVRRLVELGAKRWGRSHAADGWVVLTDPVGLPFCATTRRP